MFEAGCPRETILYLAWEWEIALLRQNWIEKGKIEIDGDE